MPVIVVDGVGAVPLPDPPLDVVYHNKKLPVAVSFDELEFWQYITGLDTPGIDGNCFTVTAITALPLSQPFTF